MAEGQDSLTVRVTLDVRCPVCSSVPAPAKFKQNFEDGTASTQCERCGKVYRKQDQLHLITPATMGLELNPIAPITGPALGT